MKLTKKCPYCGTVMPKDAQQCMFCGQMQPDNDATQFQGGDNDTTQFQGGDNDATQFQGGNGDATQFQGSDTDATQYQGGNGEATQYQDVNEETQRTYNNQNTPSQGGAYPPSYPPQMPPKKNGSNKKMLFILLAALLLIGGGVGALFLLKDKGDSTESKTTHEVITGNDTYNDETSDFKDDDGGKIAESEKDIEPEPKKDGTKEAEPVTPPAPPAETTNYYNFSGNITYKSDVYNFNMNLSVTGNRVNGDYIVTNGENVWVTLSGTMDSSGKATIKEYKGGSPTGYYFEGYLNSSSFSGKYKTTSRPLVMNFYASER